MSTEMLTTQELEYLFSTHPEHNEKSLEKLEKSDHGAYKDLIYKAQDDYAEKLKAEYDAEDAEKLDAILEAIQALPASADAFTIEILELWLNDHQHPSSGDGVCAYLADHKNSHIDRKKIIDIIETTNTYVLHSNDLPTKWRKEDAEQMLFVVESSETHREIIVSEQRNLLTGKKKKRAKALRILGKFGIAPMVSGLDYLAQFDDDAEWLIDGLLPMQSKVQFFAPPASFKTFVMLDMLFCIANGLEYHGRAVRMGKVMYLAGEGRKGLKKRIQALELQYGITNNWNNFIIQDIVSLGNEKAMQNLGNTLEIFGDVQMICFDTLANASEDLAENVADSWTTALTIMNKYLAGHTNIISWVHHSKNDTTDARGSSAKKGSVDVEFRIKSKNNKTETTSQLICTKMKDAEKSQTIHFELVKKGQSLVPITRVKMSNNAEALLELLDGKTEIGKVEFKEIADAYVATLNSKAPEKMSSRLRKELRDYNKIEVV